MSFVGLDLVLSDVLLPPLFPVISLYKEEKKITNVANKRSDPESGVGLLAHPMYAPPIVGP